MNALANLALLLGVLLIAAGIVVALITGLDWRFLIPSALAIVAGAWLLWRFRSGLKPADADGAPADGPQRAVQKPMDSGGDRPTINRRM
jgi:membrane protein implicated in regulation of membrane protease activity